MIQIMMHIQELLNGIFNTGIRQLYEFCW